ncbi:uncharacterized protein LOC120636974 [Pararge aegeria]|uniref:uncharacterized protein LOC120636974 n=1 Tax=Pararge aegeria TaxID=116150 RepID=UPI0019D2109A|nr:uncharacterized protein LOC120636974 [Pararge aegeria]
MERSMLNIKLKDKWSIRKIRKATGVTDVPRKIKRLKWRWTGHVVRSSKEKWTKEIISWYPRDGKRKKGRPQKRWEGDLPKGWRRIARDRAHWSILEEAYVQGQPD